MVRKLNDWLESYMSYTENTEPPVLYRKWVAISTIAATLQRKVKLPWGPLTFYPNFYVVLVGPAGQARKSTALNAGKRMLHELGIKLSSSALTRESLIQQLALSQTEIMRPEDNMLLMHSSLTVMASELTVFLGYQNSELIANLTDWYDCADIWGYKTKTQGENIIIGVWLNILGGTTPQQIREAFPRGAIGGGLSSRIIFVFEEQKAKKIAFPWISPENVMLRDALMHDLQEIHNMSGDFKPARSFLAAWQDWYLVDDEMKLKDQNFWGYNSRRGNHVMKLCMCLAAARGTYILSSEIFKAAMNILNETEIKMPRVFSGFGSDNKADVLDRMLQFLRFHGEVSGQDFVRSFLADVGGKVEMDNMVALLRDSGALKLRLSTKDNSMSIIYIGEPDIALLHPPEMVRGDVDESLLTYEEDESRTNP